MTTQPGPVLDPVFMSALRAALVQRVATPRPRRASRGVITGGLLALGLAGGGVAAADQLDLLPGADKLVPLAPRVSSTHTGTATVNLGARPPDATDVAIELRCLTAGTFGFPDGASTTCADSDAGLSLTTHTVPLAPGQEEVTITVSAEARWDVVAAYINRQVTPWAVNEHGETYGVENENGSPDLVAVIATNGRGGYAFARELERAHSQQPPTPGEAADWRGESVSVRVYESDGRTIVGEFRARG